MTRDGRRRGIDGIAHRKGENGGGAAMVSCASGGQGVSSHQGLLTEKEGRWS
jgi:hypothetical protein